MNARWTRTVIAAVLAATVLAACASGTSERKRNIALPTTTALASSVQVPQKIFQVASNQDGTARVTSCLEGSYERGGCLGPPVGTMTLAEYDKVVEREMPATRLTRTVVRPSDAEWSRMKRVSDAVGVVSVIARLGMEFDTAAFARSIRSGQKFDDAAWAGSSIKHVSPDAGVAAATIALNNRLSTMPGYSSRTYDQASLLSAMKTFDSEQLDVQQSGKLVPASTGFTQIAIGPYVRLNASTAELDSLMNEGLIAGVEANRFQKLSLDDSIPLIEGDKFRRSEMPNWEPALTATPDGAGSVVTIIDSGVMEAHPSLQGRMLYEACYMSVDFTSSCPDGFSNAPGSGQPCRWSTCDHGTHVAGIAVGAASTLPDGRKVAAGVAPAAQYIALRVCASENCEYAAMVTAVNVTAFYGPRWGISAANLSVELPNLVNATGAMPNALEFMARVGQPLVHSQGNDGRTDGCSTSLLGVLEVASIEKNGNPSSFTNFKAGCTDVWAPGGKIVAPTPSWTASPWVDTKSGTSMAAPHVAGAIALVHQGVRLANNNLPLENRMYPSGAVGYFLGLTNPDGLTVKIADRRTTCSNGPKSWACQGSGGSAPRLSLRRLNELFSRPGQPTPIYWTDAMRAQRELLANSARPAQVTAAARNTTRIDLNRPYFVNRMSSIYLGDFSEIGWASSRERSFRVQRVGDNSMMNIEGTSSFIKRAFIFVRDGELASLNTIVPSTGASEGVPYVDVSSGPVACSSSGYYSVYEMYALNTDARFRNLPADTELEIKTKGPAPRMLVVVMSELAGNQAFPSRRGTSMTSSIPITIGAVPTPSAIPAPSQLHVGSDANFNLRMIVTNELPEENNTLLDALMAPDHPFAMAIPGQKINNLADSGFALVQSNYGPTSPSQAGFGLKDGRKACRNILWTSYEGW